MPKVFWKSLRSRILLLAVLTFLFLLTAAISLFAFLRNRHAETLSLTEHHLVSVASNLARNYADRRSADDRCSRWNRGHHRHCHRLQYPLPRRPHHALNVGGRPAPNQICSN